MLRNLRSEIFKLHLSSPPTRGSSMGASSFGISRSRSPLLPLTSTVFKPTENSPEDLVDTAVLQAIGGRSAPSASQSSTSAFSSSQLPVSFSSTAARL